MTILFFSSYFSHTLMSKLPFVTKYVYVPGSTCLGDMRRMCRLLKYYSEREFCAKCKGDFLLVCFLIVILLAASAHLFTR